MMLRAIQNIGGIDMSKMNRFMMGLLGLTLAMPAVVKAEDTTVQENRGERMEQRGENLREAGERREENGEKMEERGEKLEERGEKVGGPKGEAMERRGHRLE